MTGKTRSVFFSYSENAATAPEAAARRRHRGHAAAVILRRVALMTVLVIAKDWCSYSIRILRQE
jgi:hypothetical protein